ncbi:MAG: hypothetical protein MSS48_02720 [Clostridiales bacterium]|nr:hypothetical protein [Clostridiales bacterium]
MVTIIDVNGAEMYAHTAWAESPDGDSFSTVEFDDADYIGTLIDRNAAEETDPTKYTWRYADAGMEEDEEDEEDEDVTADLSSDLEELADNVAEVADQINQQQVDFINTQNVTDGAIGNVNELNGTNDGVHGWTVPDGFRISQSYEDVDANPDTENVLVSTITRNTSGTDAAATFDATELVISLSGADAGNAYTLSLQSRMSELFEIPVSVSESDGTNIMLDFGVINNAVTVGPEETEEEDAGIAEAAEEDPTVDEIIADEEGADETPTGEIAGAGAWSWFESTAETASVTAAAQELRFDLAEMPVGAELSIANLKIEAGAMATPWRRSIKEVAGIAAEAQTMADDAHAEATMAQSTADAAKASASSAANAASAAQTKAEEAAVAAATAQSKADSAGTAASKAQSSANAAGEAASSAQAAAEAAQVAAGAAQADIDSQKEYFWHDANGAHVLGSKTAATRYRTDIDSEGMHIKDVSGEILEVAKFTADGAQIGNAANAHQNIDYNSWKLTDKEGNVFAEVKDLRGTDGIAEITELFYNTDQDENGQFFITYPVISITGVTVTDTDTGKTAVAEYTVDEETGNSITLKNKLSETEVLKVQFKTTESFYTYTFGIRNKEGAAGAGSFAEGHDVEAQGWFSHAEGELSFAGGIGAHAESDSQAIGNRSHAETGGVAEGEFSHAERGGIASGLESHAGGNGTVAGYEEQVAIGTYNDNKADSIFEVGNGTDGDERSNAFRVTKDGKVHDGERCLSDIGTVYMAEKDVAITTASINTHVKGATITVPAGIYVVCGEWIFDTSSTTGARNINLDIYVGENMEARSRVYANAKNYASLHASTIVMLDATTELSVRGSSSEKSPAERTRIRAVRVK